MSALAELCARRGATVVGIDRREAEVPYPVVKADVASAAEIARLALFLSTPAARHVTGQTLHVGRGTAASYG